eukprot:5015198-Amphidinium_carterae.1
MAGRFQTNWSSWTACQVEDAWGYLRDLCPCSSVQYKRDTKCFETLTDIQNDHFYLYSGQTIISYPLKRADDWGEYEGQHHSLPTAEYQWAEPRERRFKRDENHCLVQVTGQASSATEPIQRFKRDENHCLVKVTGQASSAAELQQPATIQPLPKKDNIIISVSRLQSRS